MYRHGTYQILGHTITAAPILETEDDGYIIRVAYAIEKPTGMYETVLAGDDTTDMYYIRLGRSLTGNPTVDGFIGDLHAHVCESDWMPYTDQYRVM